MAGRTVGTVDTCIAGRRAARPWWRPGRPGRSDRRRHRGQRRVPRRTLARFGGECRRGDRRGGECRGGGCRGGGCRGGGCRG
ncbi:MAG: hypothetical protein FGM52_04215 [Mycobacterium sp.]|nr:hypothetical protein [Mycobacterium sp.]